MRSSQDLKELLQRIDHRSYPAYKDIRGSYDFGSYIENNKELFEKLHKFLQDGQGAP